MILIIPCDKHIDTVRHVRDTLSAHIKAKRVPQNEGEKNNVFQGYARNAKRVSKS